MAPRLVERSLGANGLLALTSREDTPETGEPDAHGEVREWVQRARSGDARAFAWLVERYERMVLRTALRLLGRRDQAEDATQEAFLRMHRFLGRFDERRDPGPWLYRLVVNACHDIARRRSRPHLKGLDEVRERPDPTGRFGPDEIEGAVLMYEKRRLVERALAALPEKERAALVLRDIEGLPTGDVARILGSSEGTVRSQISTARLKIRQLVQRQERRQ
jgi:RNA polymerase sigma-70 factor (ECF subfamily)